MKDTCFCGAFSISRPGMWPADIIATTSGGLWATRYEEEHRLGRCVRYETVTKQLNPLVPDVVEIPGGAHLTMKMVEDAWCGIYCCCNDREARACPMHP